MYAAKQLVFPQYTPNRFLNFLHERLGTQSHTQLAKKLKVSHSHILRISYGQAAVSTNVFVSALDLLPDVSIADLRKLAGMPKGVSMPAMQPQT